MMFPFPQNAGSPSGRPARWFLTDSPSLICAPAILRRWMGTLAFHAAPLVIQVRLKGDDVYYYFRVVSGIS
jgi:hypothetical protein